MEKTNQNVVISYSSYIFTTMIASGGTTLDSTLSESEVKGPPAQITGAIRRETVGCPNLVRQTEYVN